MQASYQKPSRPGKKCFISTHKYSKIFAPLFRTPKDMAKSSLDQIMDQITNALPEGWDELKSDLDRNFHSSLRTALSKLNLVTRDEFEIQRDLLMRTREKCDALAKQVEEMEQALKNSAE